MATRTERLRRLQAALLRADDTLERLRREPSPVCGRARQAALARLERLRDELAAALDPLQGPSVDLDRVPEELETLRRELAHTVDVWRARPPLR